MLAILASSITNNGVDLKNVMITVFVLCILVALAWLATKIPGEVYFLKWLIWFVLGAAGIFIVYRFLSNL